MLIVIVLSNPELFSLKGWLRYSICTEKDKLSFYIGSQGYSIEYIFIGVICLDHLNVMYISYIRPPQQSWHNDPQTSGRN